MNIEQVNAAQEAMPMTPWAIWSELLSGWNQEHHEVFLNVLQKKSPLIYTGAENTVMATDQSDSILDALLLDTSGQRRKEIYSVFTNGLAYGNDSDLWRVALPSIRLGVERQRTLLDPALFNLRNYSASITQKLFAKWSELTQSSAIIQAGTVILASALFGRLGRKHEVESLFTCSRYLHEGGLLRAQFTDESGNTTGSLFLGNLAVILIRTFERRWGLPMSAHAINSDGAMLKIDKVLRALSLELELDDEESKLVCNQLHRLSQSNAMTRLHGYLFALLIGRASAAPLDERGWSNFLTGRRDLFGLIASDSVSQSNIADNDLIYAIADDKLKAGADGRGSLAYGVLNELTKVGTSLTVSDAIERLKGLDASQLWPIEIVLNAWVCHLLLQIKKKSGAASSALRYYTAISGPLCAVINDFDLRTADEHSVQAIFDAALGTVASPHARQFLTYRLRHFHHFCQDTYPAYPRNLDFRDLDNAEFGLKGRVRTIIPLERDYLDVTNKLKGESDKHGEMILCTKIAGILAYRCGLRRGEVARLRIMDFQDSEYPEIIIRPSSWGILKTRESERRIPLLVFMEPDELALFRAFTQQRRGKGLPADALLTVDMNGRPLSPDMLFKPFINLFREVSGNSAITPHTLRHGFANTTLIRFHVAEGLQFPSEIVALDHPRFSRKSSVRMVRNLIGREYDEDGELLGFQYLFALAKLCGHLSPRTTIRNYLHILDLILIVSLNRDQPVLSVNQMSSILNRSDQRIYQILEQQGLDVDKVNNEQWLRILHHFFDKEPVATRVVVSVETQGRHAAPVGPQKVLSDDRVLLRQKFWNGG